MASKKGKKKGKDSAAPRQEIDAVKGFIVVMLVLIVALGVFIIITRNQLDEYETAIRLAKGTESKVGQIEALGKKSLNVQAYLKLIKGSEESTVLTTYPEQYFGNIYRSREIGIPQDRVRLDGPNRDQVRKERYTEISWDLDIEDIDRRQATLFLYGVEKNSPIPKVIDISMRRNRKKDARPDSWDASFKVGYRIAGTAR